MIITDLEQLAQQAAEHHDDFEVMRYMLVMDDDLDDAQLDALVEHLAAPIVEAIDCTQCANCCQTLPVHLTPADADRLAAGLDIPLEQVMDQYIEAATSAAPEDWGQVRTSPCPFLEGKCCSIYPHRPGACRAYPAFTPDFRWTLRHIIAGADTCPIIYNLLTALHRQIDAIVR
jgi:uncharacterized protein